MIDSATGYAMAGRIWGSASGVVTVLFVGSFFSPEQQGYYYTFSSLLTLATLVELGFGGVVQQLASHEAAHGDRDRLGSLFRLGLRFYGVATVLVVLGLGVAGSAYFNRYEPAGDRWLFVWWASAMAAGTGLMLTPILSILEGANHVRDVYRTKLVQGVAGRAAGWAVMALGGGLWSIPLNRLVTTLAGIAGIGARCARFSRELGRASGGLKVDWWSEVWPLQWRFATSSFGGYLLFSLFTPVVFAHHGPELAGRMGMTLSVATALSSVAFTVMATKLPSLSMAAARKDYETLDETFRHANRLSLSLFLGASAAFWLGLLALRVQEIPIAYRFLPPLETLLLLLGLFVQQARFSLGSYLRAHKREPFAVLSLVEGAAAVVVFTLLGKHYGATGVVAGFFGLTLLTFLPACVIFMRCRSEGRAVTAVATAPVFFRIEGSKRGPV